MESLPLLTKPPTPRGFTLVEMMVVLAIIVIITGVAVTSQSSFNQTLLLSDTAYSVAFSARQAQSYGLSSRTFGSTPNAGYGIHVDRATPESYTLFADTVRVLGVATGCPIGTSGQPDAKPGNCLFDSGVGNTSKDGIVETYTFSRGFTVSSFCGKSGSGYECSTDSSPLTSLDIVFIRPNTSVVITGIRGGQSRTFSCAELRISSAGGATTKNVRVSSLGEISVGQVCP